MVELVHEQFDRRTLLKTAGGVVVGQVASTAATAAAPDAEGTTVYVGSDDSNVYAVDAATGEQAWAFTEPTVKVNSSPTVVGGTVYVGIPPEMLLAIYAATGEHVWASHASKVVFKSSPTVVDGTVYVGSNEGAVGAFDAATGDRVWRFTEVDGSVNVAPSVVGGTVFVGTNHGTLYAIDAATGEAEWTFDVPTKPLSSPTVAGNTVYVGSNDETLYAVNATGGVLEWSFERPRGALWASPTVVDGTVYVGCGDSLLYAVDAGSGEQEWAFDQRGVIKSSPTVADGTVFVGSDRGTLSAVDADNGTKEWEARPGGEIESSPTVLDGTVYVGEIFGSLFAIDATTGETVWEFSRPDGPVKSSPTVVRDPRNGDSVGSRVRLGTLGHHDAWADAADVVAPAYFVVEVTAWDTPLSPTGNLTVVVNVSNVGEQPGTQEVTAEIPGFRSTGTTVSLGPGETAEERLAIPLTEEVRDRSGVDVVVRSENASTVKEIDFTPVPEPADDNSELLAIGGGSLGALLGGYLLRQRLAGGDVGSTLEDDGAAGESTSGDTNDDHGRPGYPTEAKEADAGQAAASVQDALADVQATLDGAERAADDRAYELALEKCDEALSTAEDARETARTDAPELVEDVETNLTEAAELRDAIQAERDAIEAVDEGLAEADDRLAAAEDALEEDDVDVAESTYEATRDRLRSLDERASEFGFEDRRERLGSLLSAAEDGLAATEQRMAERRRERLTGMLDEQERVLSNVGDAVGTTPPADLRDRLDEAEAALTDVGAGADGLDAEDEERLQALRERLERERERIDAVQRIDERLREERERVERAGDALDEEAYDRAIDGYEAVEDALDALAEQAAAYGLEERGDRIEELRGRCADGRSAARSQRERAETREALASSVASARERVEAAEAALRTEDYEDALETFGSLEGDLEELAGRVDDGEFEDLLETVTGLRERREEGLAAARRGSRRREVDALEDRVSDAESELESIAANVATTEPNALRTDLDAVAEVLADAADRAAALDADDVEEDVEDARDRVDALGAAIATVDRLGSDLETARGRLDGAEGALEEGDPDEALEQLDGISGTLGELESSLEDVRERVPVADSEALAADVAALAERCEDCRERALDRQRPGPPSSIPGAPTIDVTYDDLQERDVVGKGGSADVVLMTTDDGQELAVKKPRFSGTMQAEAVERFLEEAETWERLDDHPHVVDIVGYDASPLPWIAMEYMDEGALGEQIGRFDVREAVWIALQVTEGVLHAHQRGVAHLDLKPANILLRATPGDGWAVPKVADWGLAKMLLEHSKSIEGLTPQYAAPEQVDDGFGRADQQTDIYQLGAVFYELLVGEPPFTGEPFRIIRQTVEELPTPPTEVDPSLPGALDESLLTALAKEKDDRYEHLLYLRDDLQDIYEDL